MPGRRLPKREAQRISDAKPRTSLRSYWHTLPKKKEQTPLKTRVRYNKAISVHRPSHGAAQENLSSDDPEQEGAALDVRSAAKERRGIGCPRAAAPG
ncbi:hypothetical protein SO802_035307 [Lithocarpus litseifolius]|uniref:Uncharacterized protein n=1 Tax=Lithocarpus litseifolius TaxID=425828 RepID=A0AAW2BAC0_9ROSI